MSALLCLVLMAYGLAALFAATDGHAQGTQGENFSAKPPAVLFNTDCTGSGCHGGPQGLAKGKSVGELSGYLREHYTNSRQSAAAIAAYLAAVPGANNARTERPAPENSARETPPRETSRRGKPAREAPKEEESQSIFSGFPLFPFFSSSPEETKRDEPPARSRSRAGRREESAPVQRPPAALREDTTPQTRPSTARRDDAAKPSGEGDGAKPPRSRARTPSSQLPKIEDPNLPSEYEIYRPARPRQQPLSEDEAKPSETTATNAPSSAPETAPADVVLPSSTSATPPSQTPRSRSRASQRQQNSSAATQPVAPPTNAPSASQSAPPAPPAQPISSAPPAKPREPIFD